MNVPRGTFIVFVFLGRVRGFKFVVLFVRDGDLKK
jgi:hypothetical protein